jgi:hypothetical protein
MQMQVKEESMHTAKLLFVFVTAVIAFMNAHAETQAGHSPSMVVNIKKALIDGSPWHVKWRRHDNGRSGVFTQSFIETPDGKVKTTTDEIGPYETDVQFPSNDKAVWTSPHQNVVKISLLSKIAEPGRMLP